MKPLFALLVAAVVVIGTAPIGAAAVVSPDASPATLGTGPGPAQTQDTETVTSTPTPNTTESNTTETASGTETTTESDANESNGTAEAIEPGAQLAGVVAVQRTEVESEVGSRAFGQRVAAAASNDSKAEIVAGEVNDSGERLADLRTRLDELEAAHEAGEISEGRYRADTAQVSAEINAVERRLEQSNDTAASLPADVREANGINTSNIERLRNEARNLSGSEVAEIARSIGGERSGRGLGDNVGPPGRSGEASGPTGPPNNADAGPPENRTGNGSGGEESASDRGAGNGSDGERGSGDGAGNGSENPQESEANRDDRENGEPNSDSADENSTDSDTSNDESDDA